MPKAQSWGRDAQMTADARQMARDGLPETEIRDRLNQDYPTIDSAIIRDLAKREIESTKAHNYMMSLKGNVIMKPTDLFGCPPGRTMVIAVVTISATDPMTGGEVEYTREVRIDKGGMLNVVLNRAIDVVARDALSHVKESPKFGVFQNPSGIKASWDYLECV